MQLKNNTSLIIFMSFFAGLTAVGSYIKLPLFYLPVTLQTFFVMMSGNVLGPKFGAFSQILYLVLGLTGVPVFAYGGGLGYVFQPTFGYLLSYPFAAVAIGLAIKMALPIGQNRSFSFRRKLASYFFADIVGVILIFGVGIAYFYLNLKMGWYLRIEQLSKMQMRFDDVIRPILLVFIPIDILKAFIASWFTVRLQQLHF